MASGNEILAYGGNAALGANGTGAAIQSTTPGNLDYLNSVLDRVARDDHNNATQDYMQRIKDRDATLGLLSNMQIDVPINEEYRPALEADINDATKLWINDPKGVVSDPKKFQQLQALNSRFREKLVNAKANQIEIMKMEQDYANNTNPTYRKNLAEHIQQQKALGPNHLVLPYAKQASLVGWLYKHTSPGITTTKTKTDSEGDVQTVVTNVDGAINRLPSAKTRVIDEPGTFIGSIEGDGTNGTTPGFMYGKYQTSTNLPEIYRYYSPERLTPTEYTDLQDQINRGYNLIVQNPEFMTPQSFNDINAAIKAANENEGIKPGETFYTPPITTKNPNTGEEILTATPTELAIALSVAGNYRKSGVELRPSESLQKQKLTLEQARTQLSMQQENAAQAGLANAKAKTENARRSAEVGLLNAQIYKETMAGKKDAVSLEKDRLVSKPANDVVNLFDRVDKMSGFQPASTVSQLLSPTAQTQAFKDLGIDSTWELVALPKSEQTARQILSEPTYLENGKIMPNSPKIMYAIRNPNGDPNSVKIISYDPDKMEVVKAVDLSQGLNEITRYNSNYNARDAEKRLNQIKSYINVIQGGDYQDVDLGRIRQGAQGLKPPLAPASVPSSPSPSKSTPAAVNTPAPVKIIETNGRRYVPSTSGQKVMVNGQKALIVNGKTYLVKSKAENGYYELGDAQ